MTAPQFLGQSSGRPSRADSLSKPNQTVLQSEQRQPRSNPPLSFLSRYGDNSPWQARQRITIPDVTLSLLTLSPPSIIGLVLLVRDELGA